MADRINIKRWSIVLTAILLFGGVFMLASCSGGGEETSSAATLPGEAPVDPPQDEGSEATGPDEPIDVNALLTENGFKESRFLPIQVDSAYWLAPFATVAELELDGDDTITSCIFSFRRNDYESGPFAAYSFTTHNNMAKIKAYPVDPQGAKGEALSQVVEMPIQDITPQSLKDAFADSLPQCGDTTLR